ncbi:TetR/AcrR family transcriptional regulator [Nocardia fusca]|uniref:TetR/AcrR family transcriptional regulator n=1 Tax=Nocardia fusca TaxID=941183 RepID=UPI0037C79B38
MPANDERKRRSTSRRRGSAAAQANVAIASTPRSKVRRELVEDQILTEAARLFAQRGFAGTNLLDIAEAVGITRPALYYYVRSKEELLTRIVAAGTEAPAAEIKRLVNAQDADAATRLRAVAYSIALRRATDPFQLQMLIRSESELPADLARSYRATQRATLRELVGLIDGGIDAGEFRSVDATSAALAIIGMCNWVAWWQESLDGQAPDDVARQIADLALAMVRQADGASKNANGGTAAAIARMRSELDYLDRTLESRGPIARKPKKSASAKSS